MQTRRLSRWFRPDSELYESELDSAKIVW